MDEWYDLMREADTTFRQVIRQYKKDMGKLLEDVCILEFYFMKVLSEKGTAQPVMSIANELHVSPSVITANYTKLMNKGIIYRERALTDKRVVELGLTEEGKKLIMELEKRQTDYLMNKFKGFSQEEIETLMAQLRRLLQN
ncbi:MarR family winged helix-turn-helix transcriptional regulator [Brevibacillus ginsengisoli]|uniref:MarR family winged helix-turn-helix transcriptional regulator n=1 Tax=Brevibacillus ginsengisoli TaxID=363854 RepID=UPI003CEA769C